jgi:hypothetical protein
MTMASVVSPTAMGTPPSGPTGDYIVTIGGDPVVTVGGDYIGVN